MAYDDSEALQPNSSYSLGGYSFELKVQNVHEPGEQDVTSIFAICHSPDGTRETIATDFQAGTTVESWCVEANETEASVYATIREPAEGGGHSSELDTSPTPQPIPSSSTVSGVENVSAGRHINLSFSVSGGGSGLSFHNATYLFASPTPNSEFHAYATVIESGDVWTDGTITLASTYTYNNKTVYYYYGNFATASSTDNLTPSLPIEQAPGQNAPQAAWTIVYGTPESGDPKEVLVGRFAIDLREADGGPDGDWDEPGSVGPDPEKHFTLTVSVTGASAGSNSGTPLEAQEQTTYGSGGTGGNGGGGGAGASTVIIYDFATNKADSVVQEATAQGPGTGGPGGKGGKGGDGCILIFY